MNIFNTMITRGGMTEEEAFALVGIILLFMGIAAIVSIAWGIIVHIVSSIPYFNMARKAGFHHAWLAFIPYGQYYVIMTLSHREFNIFNKFRTNDRKKAFWAYLIVAAIGVIINICNTFLDGIADGLNTLSETSEDPSVLTISLIGIIVILLLYLVLVAVTFVVNLIAYLIRWRAHYDLLMTYGMPDHAMWASIVSLFVPLVIIVFSFIIMNKEPDYGFGNYYMTDYHKSDIIG
ncbi:MAG: hypothetical protein IJ336_01130 [Lachnospiraceae bacterium]|nr:hypothetical protein [Lachnospiraceae bacterium]